MTGTRKRLALNAETLRRLDGDELQAVGGGRTTATTATTITGTITKELCPTTVTFNGKARAALVIDLLFRQGLAPGPKQVPPGIENPNAFGR